MGLAERLDVLESESAVRRLALEYCHGADKRDLQRFAAVWTPDAVWFPRENVEARGVDAICGVVQVQWRAFARYVHWTINHVVQIRGDNARGECDVAVAVQLADRWYFGGGSYYDRDVRVGGRWLIESREARGDFDFTAPPDDDEVPIDMPTACAPFLTPPVPVVADPE